MKDLGEFGLIGEIRKSVRRGPGVTLGIGDDTAVVRPRAGHELLFTTDMLVEGIHFRAGDEASAREIGQKAMAVNLSDIAAMGGVPTHAVAAVGLPGGLDVTFARDLMKGLRTTAEAWGVSLVGGDTNRSGVIIVSVALLGEVKKGKAVRRSGAKPGDVIFVTGNLGGSYASRKHLNFTPRLAESAYLGGYKVSAMMDLSDGLASDLGKLATESGVGAVLSAEAVPLSTWAKSLDAALTDGEDFELLFTLSPREAARLSLASKPAGLALFRPVGKITPCREGLRIFRADGRYTPIEDKGYDHFR
jgi:thiamine-monophosphate kinase